MRVSLISYWLLYIEVTPFQIFPGHLSIRHPLPPPPIMYYSV